MTPSLPAVSSTRFSGSSSPPPQAISARPLNTDWDGNELLLSDILGTDADLVSRDLDSSIEKEMLYNAIKALNPREKDIVRLRYGLGQEKEHTQKEVADMMGISQSYISRLEKRIIEKLKNELRKMA